MPRAIDDKNRQLAFPTISLLRMIAAGEVKVTLVHSGIPGSMTEQSIEGMGLAAAAMMALNGITAEELAAYEQELQTLALRRNGCAGEC